MRTIEEIVDIAINLVETAQFYDTIKVIVIKHDPSFASMFDIGWGNGYVVLPPNHSSYGKAYDDIDVIVHGGLTFGEFTQNLTKWKEVKNLNGYVIGFDTAHYRDTLHRWPEKLVRAEAEHLKEQLINFPKCIHSE